ncbi:MAG: Gfo/Idh/MocA family protein [Anaerolineae bacterium]
MSTGGSRTIRCAIVGYGATFNFGKAHARWLQGAPGLELVAVLSRSVERTEAAQRDWPWIRTYHDMDELVAATDIDMVSLVTPPYTHAPFALKALRAGKHVVVDKPMCLTTDQATLMIEEARTNGRMLAVFHNRRHDGNYRTIQEIVRSGRIGEIFQVELYAGGFNYPWGGLSVYADKSASGNALYGWGAHGVDWILQLIPSRIRSVTGFFHKLVWHDVSVEDHARAVLLFENGVEADITWSHIAAVGKPLWRILGTQGAIEDSGKDALFGYCAPPGSPEALAGACPELVAQSPGALKLVTREEGRLVEQTVPYMPSDWDNYYRQVADHLLRGGPVPVPGEDGRRTIDVMETAERSALAGHSLSVRYP